MLPYNKEISQKGICNKVSTEERTECVLYLLIWHKYKMLSFSYYCDISKVVVCEHLSGRTFSGQMRSCWLLESSSHTEVN
jgi:hypothetical protein